MKTTSHPFKIETNPPRFQSTLKNTLVIFFALATFTSICTATPVRSGDITWKYSSVGVSDADFKASGIEATCNFAPSGSYALDWMIISVQFHNYNNESAAISGSAFNSFTVAGHQSVTVPFNVYQNKANPIKSFPFHYVIGASTPPPSPISKPVSTFSAPGGQSFGTINQRGATNSLTFRIANTGNASLVLSGSPTVRLSGADVAQFSVTIQPAINVSAGGSSSFVIQYAPTATGTHNATVTVTSNDTANPTRTLTISGSASFPVSNEPVFFNANGNAWQRNGSTWTVRLPNGQSIFYDVVSRGTFTNSYVTNAQGQLVRYRNDSRITMFIPDINWTARAYGLWLSQQGYNNGAWMFVGGMTNVR